MRPHPRIRKTIKWGASLLTVLLVVLWVWSMSHGLILKFAPGLNIGVFRGQLHTNRFDGTLRLWESYVSVCDPRYFEFAWENERWNLSAHGNLSLPLWLPVAISALIAVFVWRLDGQARRRARTGSCLKCGYSRTGLAPDRQCPECGAAAPPPPSATNISGAATRSDPA